MNNFVHHTDCPCNLINRKVFTNSQLQIPSLELLGHHKSKHANRPQRLHHHASCIEITYVAKGHMIFYIDDIPYHVYGGHVFLVPANTVHSTGNTPIPSREIFWLQVDISAPNLFDLNDQWGLDLRSKLCINQPQVIRCPNESKLLLESAFNLFETSPHSPNYLVSSKLLSFLYSILDPQTTDFCFSYDINHVVNYILTHLHDDLQLEDLAHYANLSLSRFKSKFKEQVGMTPGEFINTHKIYLAKTYLLENQNITEIAFKLGFSSSAYFSVVFKRFTSLSPTEYIKQHLKD